MGTELVIAVLEPDVDAEVVDGLTRDLRRELLDLDVESVSPASSGPAPPGAKGLDLAAVGELVVQLKGSAQLVAAVVGSLRSWLRRSPSPRRSVTISIDGKTLELSAASDEQQQRLIDEFVRSLSSS